MRERDVFDWHPAGDRRLPAACRFATAVLLADSDVMVAGGYSDQNRNTAGVWRFQR